MGPPAYSPGLRGLLGPVRAGVLVPAWELGAGERASFEAAFREAGGGEPGPAAVAAYQATRLVLAAVGRAAGGAGGPTREGVRLALDRAAAEGTGRAGVGLVEIGR